MTSATPFVAILLLLTCLCDECHDKLSLLKVLWSIVWRFMIWCKLSFSVMLTILISQTLTTGAHLLVCNMHKELCQLQEAGGDKPRPARNIRYKDRPEKPIYNPAARAAERRQRQQTAPAKPSSGDNKADEGKWLQYQYIYLLYLRIWGCVKSVVSKWTDRTRIAYQVT